MSHQHVFNELTSLIPTLDGWCTPERSCDLARMVIDQKPSVTVCLGVWGGRDTFALAMGHRAVGAGKCIAVDPWLADASVQGQGPENAAWWGNQQMHDLVFERFVLNMNRLGLAPWIAVHKAKASDVRPPEEIGLLIVDGNHGPDSISDVEKWAPHIPVNGICYCDDIGWEGDNVREAVARLQKMGFEEMFKRDTGAFFKRTKK